MTFGGWCFESKYGFSSFLFFSDHTQKKTWLTFALKSKSIQMHFSFNKINFITLSGQSSQATPQITITQLEVKSTSECQRTLNSNMKIKKEVLNNVKINFG